MVLRPCDPWLFDLTSLTILISIIIYLYRSCYLHPRQILLDKHICMFLSAHDTPGYIHHCLCHTHGYLLEKNIISGQEVCYFVTDYLLVALTSAFKRNEKMVCSWIKFETLIKDFCLCCEELLHLVIYTTNKVPQLQVEKKIKSFETTYACHYIW